MHTEKIGVVYLCRANEKIEAFFNFITSYKNSPSHCIHKLIIIFKGFQDHPENYLTKVQAIFNDVDYHAIYLSDEGFDIGSYLNTAKIVNYDYLVFFNTYTMIIANGWLDYLYKTINQQDVGLVGTTASYESIYSSQCLLHTFSNLYFSKKFNSDSSALTYYRWLIEAIDPNNNKIKQYRRYTKLWIKSVFQKIKFQIKFFFKKNIEKEFVDIPKRILRWKKFFSPFPSPNIRSNGFMISRKLLLDLFNDYNFKTKEDACRFESGTESLTRKVWELGLKTLLVDKNGTSYDVKDWPKSKTFRLDNQENLLISDNQTRNYDNFSKEERLVHTWVSWGGYFIRFEDQFPNLGFSFDTKSLNNMTFHNSCTKQK